MSDTSVVSYKRGVRLRRDLASAPQELTKQTMKIHRATDATAKRSSQKDKCPFFLTEESRLPPDMKLLPLAQDIPPVIKRNRAITGNRRNAAPKCLLK